MTKRGGERPQFLPFDDLLCVPIEELHARRRVIVAEAADIGKALARKNAQIRRLTAAIRQVAARDHAIIGVSDHAVLRYLERVEGVDVDAIRKRLRNYALTGRATDDGGIVDAGDGLRVAISEGTTITTIWRVGDDGLEQDGDAPVTATGGSRPAPAHPRGRRFGEAKEGPQEARDESRPQSG